MMLFTDTFNRQKTWKKLGLNVNFDVAEEAIWTKAKTLESKIHLFFNDFANVQNTNWFRMRSTGLAMYKF